jgi:hypothetical protein
LLAFGLVRAPLVYFLNNIRYVWPDVKIELAFATM